MSKIQVFYLNHLANYIHGKSLTSLALSIDQSRKRHRHGGNKTRAETQGQLTIRLLTE
jgi:hypothetical protein